MVSTGFDRNVFVNCPFDTDYQPIMQAVLFCLVRLGFNPRFATERSNAAELRIEKIYELIKDSKYSIHDLSRCKASQPEELFRLNMPFELGIDFGCRRYGGYPYSEKVVLILEEERYLYQAAISDLAGIDIKAHKGNFQNAVREVRNWLNNCVPEISSCSAGSILAKYEDFQKWHYEHQLAQGHTEDDIQNYPTSELLNDMLDWKSDNQLGKPIS